jgi:hypothetical protein
VEPEDWTPHERIVVMSYLTTEALDTVKFHDAIEAKAVALESQETAEAERAALLSDDIGQHEPPEPRLVGAQTDVQECGTTRQRRR